MMIHEIGSTIKRMRKEKGLKQEELARIAGISRVTLSKLENGKISGITITALVRIVERLGYEIDFREPSPLPTLEDLVNSKVARPGPAG